MVKRVAGPDIAALSSEQQEVFKAIASGPRGVVGGPLLIWLHSPELASRAAKLGEFCRYHTGLPKKLVELSILTVAAEWRSSFEWFVHAPLGAAAGLDAAVLESIRTGGEPDFRDADERAVYEFTSEMIRSHSVEDETYERARMAVGDKSLVELIGVIGYYVMISMTINAFRIPLPDGEVDPFAGARRE